MDAEIGIIGLGTMGSMALWHLAHEGVPVIGFEQFGIGHDYSGVGGESRLFRTAYSEGNDYVPIIQDAYKYWRQLENETGTSLLNMTGGFQKKEEKINKYKNQKKNNYYITIKF